MTWNDLRETLVGRGLIEAAGSRGASDAAVTGIAYDSRTVAAGQVFVALKGVHADGSSFVRQAIQRGAAAVVSEQPAPADAAAPWAQVSDARLAMAVLAAAFERHPSDEMRVIGITGTNGKTTTAYVLASIFEAAGVRCGVLGTVAYRIGDEVRESTRTTPEAPDVQKLLREMVDRGCGACVMEVSSHALSLRRVDGTTFAAGVFTNLTRDHLDFHVDMEAYFQAKRRLFEMLPPGAPGLINADDPRGAALAEMAGRPVTYAIHRHGGHHARTAVVRARGPDVRRPDASRHAARAIEAGRPAERLQHPGGDLRGGRARPAVRRHRTGHSGACWRAAAVSSWSRVRPTKSRLSSTTRTRTTR